DRISYNAYNDRGQLTFSIDAVGAITGFTYDTSGRVIKTTQYATLFGGTLTDEADWPSDIATWLAAGTHAANARVSGVYYTERGEVAYAVDAAGYVTSDSYDDAGRLASTSRYPNTVSLSDSSTIGDVASATSGTPHTTSYTYDTLGRVKDV